MATEQEMERQMIDLELRFMRQERLVDDLNDVIVAQRREIDRLLADVKALREQMLAGLDAALHEKPPHY